MLTYQLHTRCFRGDGSRLKFPNRANLEIRLAPATAFGTKDDYSRTAVRARKGHLLFNANNGQWGIRSEPPLEPLEVVIESPNTLIRLKGNELRYEFQCESLDQLNGVLAGLKWILPPLLNLEFLDPPSIEHIRGQVGDTKFRWEHLPDEWRIRFRLTNAEELEQHVANSFEWFALLTGTKNRRLAAALCYFHVAVRLSVAGDSPWEFMAESILNYAKCLEVLFTTSEASKDDVRAALAKLGYSHEEVEGDFVPLLILRSWVDVAHPKVALFKPTDLQVLYRYIHRAEAAIRQMLLRIIEKCKSGEFTVAETDLSLNGEERRGMDRLVATMASRLGPGL